MVLQQPLSTDSRTIENPVIRDRVSFISLASETGGTLTEIEVRLMPGGGTPLHFHRHLTETFEAVSGALGLEVAGEQVMLQPGDAITVGRGTLHRFHNPGLEPVIFKTLITPGSTGFEQSLRILYGLATDGLTDRRSRPRRLSHLAILSDLGDMHMTGPLSLLAPLLRRIVRSAKADGRYDTLVSRYCSGTGAPLI